MNKSTILRILSSDEIKARQIIKILDEVGQYRVKAKFKNPGIRELTDACAIVSKSELKLKEQEYRINQAKTMIVFHDGLSLELHQRFTVVNPEKRTRYFLQGWISKGSMVWICDCPAPKRQQQQCKHAIACEIFCEAHQIQLHNA